LEKGDLVIIENPVYLSSGMSNEIAGIKSASKGVKQLPQAEEYERCYKTQCHEAFPFPGVQSQNRSTGCDGKETEGKTELSQTSLGLAEDFNVKHLMTYRTPYACHVVPFFRDSK
jgi:hypothetical protein